MASVRRTKGNEWTAVTRAADTGPQRVDVPRSTGEHTATAVRVVTTPTNRWLP